MRKSILLLRHGTTDAVDSVLGGQMRGIYLNADGQRQAAALAARISSLDALVSSPLERAVQTASIIGKVHGLQPVIYDALTERDFGAWTGKRFQDLEKDSNWIKLDTPLTSRLQDCESIAEVQARALRALQNIVSEMGWASVVAIVSHAAVIRALLAHAAGMPVLSYLQFTVAPASISEIENSEHAFRVVRVNDCAHLL